MCMPRALHTYVCQNCAYACICVHVPSYLCMCEALHVHDHVSTVAYTSVYPHANRQRHTHACTPSSNAPSHTHAPLSTSVHEPAVQRHECGHMHQQVCRKRCIHDFNEHRPCVGVAVPVSMHMNTHMSSSSLCTYMAAQPSAHKTMHTSGRCMASRLAPRLGWQRDLACTRQQALIGAVQTTEHQQLHW
jgi:hypothetical protein